MTYQIHRYPAELIDVVRLAGRYARVVQRDALRPDRKHGETVKIRIARLEAAARQREAVEGAHTERVGEVTEHVEGHAALGPFAELIWPIRHEEVMAPLDELPQGLPAMLRLVGGN